MFSIQNRTLTITKSRQPEENEVQNNQIRVTFLPGRNQALKRFFPESYVGNETQASTELRSQRSQLITADWHPMQCRDWTETHLTLCLRPLSCLKHWQRTCGLLSYHHCSTTLTSQLGSRFFFQLQRKFPSSSGYMTITAPAETNQGTTGSKSKTCAQAKLSSLRNMQLSACQ